MTVQRFNPVASAAISLSEQGEYVKYEDYEKLAAKLSMINGLMEAAEQVNKLAQEATEKLVQERDALAAENAGLKSICEDRRTFIMNGVQLGYIQVPTVEADPALETIRIAMSPQEPTPATDAFLAEVRVQESAPLVRALTIIANSEQHDGETVVCDFDSLISVAAGALRDHYATQLRKGDAQ